MIRDPHFWKRFSVAVHEDDLAKEELAKQDGKNEYVITSTLPFPEHSPSGTPTAQTHTETSQPLRPLSPMRPLSLFFAPNTSPQEAPVLAKQQKRRSRLQKTPSTKPLLRPDIPPPTRTISIRTERATISSRPGTQRSNLTTTIAPAPFSTSSSRPATQRSNFAPSTLTETPASPARSFFRTGNLSVLSLSLSGRPNSRFNFVTTISADADHSDTWLMRQKKKERHRTWLCWAFWICLLLLVAAVVVTVLLLRAHHVIRF